MKYKWVTGSKVSLDAQTVGEEIEKLRKKNNGFVRKEDVLEEAKHPDNPLHTWFEWNDTVAAEEYRLQQAGYIIRSIAIVFDNPENEQLMEVRAFVSVTQENESKPSYTSVSVAMKDVFLKTQVFKQSLDEINAWQRKYKHLRVYEGIFEEIERLNELAQTEKKITIKTKR